jgi:hypothetical protein
MLFGYLLTRPLIVLAGVFAHLPASACGVFAGCWTRWPGRSTGSTTWAHAPGPG